MGRTMKKKGEGKTAGRAAIVKSPPVQMLPPAATRKAPPMSVGQQEVRQTQSPWSTDDGRVETLSRSLKAVSVGMRGPVEKGC